MSNAANVWSRAFDILIDRGEGSVVWDTSGKMWLDFTSGIAVTSTGHSHPRVVAAISTQAARMMHVQPNCYKSPLLESLCGKLNSITPDSMQKFFVTNSGAEAVEAAVKLAKQVTGRPEIIVLEGSFHGRTHQAMAMTTSKNVYRRGYGVLPGGVTVAPFFEEGLEPPDMLKTFENLIYARVSPLDVAAIVYEPVQGEGGYREVSHEYQRYLRKWCYTNGVLLVADEIQSGMGRTGRMFAFEHAAIDPDILIVAKGLASGFPIAAIGSSSAIMDKWVPGSHGGTYGGNPMGCAAAMATIDVILEHAMENGQNAALKLRTELCQMAQEDPRIDRISGRGLMIGVKMHSVKFGAELQHALYEKGVLVLTATGGVLRLMPPLVVTEYEVGWFLDAMRQALLTV